MVSFTLHSMREKTVKFQGSIEKLLTYTINNVITNEKVEYGMARPIKSRRVCYIPNQVEFVPSDGKNCKKVVLLTVGGYSLKIESGDFQLCNGRNEECLQRECDQREILKKEKGSMRIAVTYENGEVFQHFGRTAFFKIYDVENGQTVDSKVMDTNGSCHSALANFLQLLSVDVLLCSGIGGGAQMALREVNVSFFGGVFGDADEAVKALLTNELTYQPNLQCDHHHAYEHGEKHGGCGNCREGN